MLRPWDTPGKKEGQDSTTGNLLPKHEDQYSIFRLCLPMSSLGIPEVYTHVHTPCSAQVIVSGWNSVRPKGDFHCGCVHQPSSSLIYIFFKYGQRNWLFATGLTVEVRVGIWSYLQVKLKNNVLWARVKKCFVNDRCIERGLWCFPISVIKTEKDIQKYFSLWSNWK